MNVNLGAAWSPARIGGSEMQDPKDTIIQDVRPKTRHEVRSRKSLEQDAAFLFQHLERSHDEPSTMYIISEVLRAQALGMPANLLQPDARQIVESLGGHKPCESVYVLSRALGVLSLAMLQKAEAEAED